MILMNPDIRIQPDATDFVSESGHCDKRYRKVRFFGYAPDGQRKVNLPPRGLIEKSAAGHGRPLDPHRTNERAKTDIFVRRVISFRWILAEFTFAQTENCVNAR